MLRIHYILCSTLYSYVWELTGKVNVENTLYTLLSTLYSYVWELTGRVNVENTLYTLLYSLLSTAMYGN